MVDEMNESIILKTVMNPMKERERKQLANNYYENLEKPKTNLVWLSHIFLILMK